jgi:hypothetical protein
MQRCSLEPLYALQYKGYTQESAKFGLRLSAAVLPNFSLYITFLRHIINISPPIFFISRSGSPYIIPLYPTKNIKYHYLTIFIFYYYFYQLLNRGALCKGRYSAPLDLGDVRALSLRCSA